MYDCSEVKLAVIAGVVILLMMLLGGSCTDRVQGRRLECLKLGHSSLECRDLLPN